MAFHQCQYSWSEMSTSNLHQDPELLSTGTQNYRAHTNKHITRGRSRNLVNAVSSLVTIKLRAWKRRSNNSLVHKAPANSGSRKSLFYVAHFRKKGCFQVLMPWSTSHNGSTLRSAQEVRNLSIKRKLQKDSDYPFLKRQESQEVANTCEAISSTPPQTV